MVGLPLNTTKNQTTVEKPERVTSAKKASIVVVNNKQNTGRLRSVNHNPQSDYTEEMANPQAQNSMAQMGFIKQSQSPTTVLNRKMPGLQRRNRDAKSGGGSIGGLEPPLPKQSFMGTQRIMSQGKNLKSGQPE